MTGIPGGLLEKFTDRTPWLRGLWWVSPIREAIYIPEVNLKMGCLDSDDLAQPLAVVHFNEDILKLLRGHSDFHGAVLLPMGVARYKG